MSIELDQIYIRLRTSAQHQFDQENVEAERNPGASDLGRGRTPNSHDEMPAQSETPSIMSVEKALQNHMRLVVLGDPGSGKTTLLRYLSLPYAKDMGDKGNRIQEKLGKQEPARLPIFMELRKIGAFLKEHVKNDGTEGHAVLLEFLTTALKNEQVDLPERFFDQWLQSGDAVVLLDGLDEVADPKLRDRVARLVESFVRKYKDCRYVVTSRVVGYEGTARLGEAFVTTKVRNFSLQDVKEFLTNWHALLALGLHGDTQQARDYANDQTQQLLDAITANERIRELAINPLMLTVIALVHRDRVKLPDRRAELYAEAVEVLLGKLDDARGITDNSVLENQTFDAGDKRIKLQAVALYMHQKETKEIEAEVLRNLLTSLFLENLSSKQEAEKAAQRFIQLIRERSGLLIDRGPGLFAFSHLTFQEYLAALALVAKENYLEETKQYLDKPWWNEAILLAAGHLSSQSPERTGRFIQAVADQPSKHNPYACLALAANCIRDVGPSRISEVIRSSVTDRLKAGVEAKPSAYTAWMGNIKPLKKLSAQGWIKQRALAMEALALVGEGFWKKPFGEPEWVQVPEGKFWLGDGGTQHQVNLPAYRISKVPVTNAQYHLFVQATDYRCPGHWDGDLPPKGKESHPVANVSYWDALAYCEWLSRQLGYPVTLPTEAQWEKAARGGKDKRTYPWGNDFNKDYCNSWELGWGDTTPVGIFSDGVSPYSCLDMVGNVLEWTNSLYEGYPYEADGSREEVNGKDDDRDRVLRGGAFNYGSDDVRCSLRFIIRPDGRHDNFGFRVCASPFL